MRVVAGGRQLGISPPVQDRLPTAAYLSLARAAEEAGYDWLFMGEVAGPDAFAVLGAITGVTSRISLATGVVSTFTRSPALLAMGFATLHDLAPGRFMAGIGASSRVIAEDWNAVPYTSPLHRAREVTAILRRLLAGERATAEGEVTSIRGFQLAPPEPRPVPVMIGAMHPSMLELGGAIADVVYLAFCPTEDIAGRVTLVRRGAEKAGRDPATVRIALSLNVYAGDELDVAQRQLRRFLLRYVSVPTHWSSLARYHPALERARLLWLDGEHERATDAVSEESLSSVCCVGSGADILRRAEATWAEGVDLVTLQALGARLGDVDGPLGTVRNVSAARKAAAATAG